MVVDASVGSSGGRIRQQSWQHRHRQQHGVREVPDDEKKQDEEIDLRCRQELNQFKNIAFDMDQFKDAAGGIDMEQLGKFDLLAWWRALSPSFPILSILAREHLATQASSAEVERLFSMGGDLVSKKRNRLAPTRVAKLVLGKLCTGDPRGVVDQDEVVSQKVAQSWGDTLQHLDEGDVMASTSGASGGKGSGKRPSPKANAKSGAAASSSAGK